MRFKPSVDLFVNEKPHEVAIYMYSVADDGAAFADALAQYWRCEWILYANPPWKLIKQVLAELRAKNEYTMVIPDCQDASWYRLLKKLAQCPFYSSARVF